MSGFSAAVRTTIRHRADGWSDDPTQEQLVSPHVVHDSWGRTRVFRKTPLMRLQEKIAVADSGCHEFQGFLNNKGYGQIGIGPRLMYAHRVMWIAHRGPIPGGLYVCHVCDNPRCCNIEHLFLGTPKENMQDMAVKGRAVVRRGDENPRTKLTAGDCADIRAASAAGESNRSIARRYGMPGSHSWIGAIARGRVRAES